jgi:FkbM family methyltransferase
LTSSLLVSVTEKRHGYVVNKEHIISQALLRAWPFPRGAGRLTDKLFSKLKFRQSEATVRTTDGFWMTVMPNELIGRHIYLTGEFDRTTVEVLVDFSEPGDVLLDIGANIGYVSGCFLKNVDRSKVISVEPQPSVFDLLCANLRQFSASQYATVPVALSDRNEEGWLESSEQNLGSGKLITEAKPNATRVTVQSADNFFSSLGLEHLELVKIDVEGQEAAVFKASAAHLQRLQPRAIFFEDHLQQAAPLEFIGSILNSIGYRVFGVEKHLTKISLIPITTKSDCTYNDYLAISRTRNIPKRAWSKHARALRPLGLHGPTNTL